MCRGIVCLADGYRSLGIAYGSLLFDAHSAVMLMSTGCVTDGAVLDGAEGVLGTYSSDQSANVRC